VLASLKLINEPAQTDVGPDIPSTVGKAPTGTVLVAVAVPQLLVMVYEITADPAEIPVTIPLLVPIVATAGFALVHAPPPTKSAIGTLAPIHTDDGPVIGLMIVVTPIAITWVTVVEPHPLVTLYLTVSNPDNNGVNNPPLLMVALLLVTLQTPPEVASVYNDEVPMHNANGPDIAAGDGKGLMVMTLVADAEPQELLTV